jgi:hypothetical protein
MIRIIRRIRSNLVIVAGPPLAFRARNARQTRNAVPFRPAERPPYLTPSTIVRATTYPPTCGRTSSLVKASNPGRTTSAA